MLFHEWERILCICKRVKLNCFRQDCINICTLWVHKVDKWGGMQFVQDHKDSILVRKGYKARKDYMGHRKS